MILFDSYQAQSLAWTQDPCNEDDIDNNMSKGSKNGNNDAFAKDDANLGLSRKRNDAPMADVIRIDDEREQ